MKYSGKKIREFIYGLPIIETIVAWSKQYAFPGFANVPIYYILAFVIDEVKKDNLVTRSEAVAYNFFISLFPLTIFILPILSRTPLAASALSTLREAIRGILPLEAESYIFGLVENIQNESQLGWLSLGFFLSIFFASSGMVAIMNAFDKSYDITFKTRGYIKKRFIGLILTILLSCLTFASVIFIILGQGFITYLCESLGLEIGTSILFNILKWVTLLLLFYSVITSIYRYGPSMYKRINFFSPGASLATFFSIFSSLLFSSFINNFGRYNEIYGTIGSLIVILIWMQINAFILMAGFELNASIAVNRDLRKRSSDEKSIP